MDHPAPNVEENPNPAKRRRVEGDTETRAEIEKLLGFIDPKEMAELLVSFHAQGIDVTGAILNHLTHVTDQPKCKIFVRSLGWETRTEQLRQAFEPYGLIKDCVVVEKDGKSKGFGFVTFSNAAETAKALENPIKEIDGRDARCNLAAKPDYDRRGPSHQGNSAVISGGAQSGNREDWKIFVRSLNWNTNDETLAQAFETYGEIHECTVIVDKETRKSKGYGFVTFKEASSAQEALKNPKKEIDGRIVHVNLASERKKQPGGQVHHQQQQQQQQMLDPVTAQYYQMQMQAAAVQPLLQQQYMQQLQQMQQQQLAASGQAGAAQMVQPNQYAALAAQQQQLAAAQSGAAGATGNPAQQYAYVIQQPGQAVSYPQLMQQAASGIQQ